MPSEGRTDDLHKFLNEQKSMEDRKQALIADLLKQREASMKDFDDKLAMLGYQANSAGGTKRTRGAITAGKPEPEGEGKA